MERILNSFFALPGWLIATFSLIGTCLLMIYAAHLGNQSYEQKMNHLKHPDRYTDQEICIGFVNIIQINDDEIIAIDSRSYRYIFQVNSDIKLNKGETYSFRGKITDSGNILVDIVQHHPYRKYKYLLSSLSLILVIFLIIKYIRIDSAGLYLRKDQKINKLIST